MRFTKKASESKATTAGNGCALRIIRIFKSMNQHRITIKDLARELGISKSTVSRALRGHPNVKRETREAVKALAEKLDYHPDQ
ncbi:MAG: LacI family DNA-binding transcriptional regulator, partial [Bacteroidota bacterium]